VATAPQLEYLHLNDNPVAAAEGYPARLFPFLAKLREVDNEPISAEAIQAATDELARNTPIIARELAEVLAWHDEEVGRERTNAEGEGGAAAATSAAPVASAVVAIAGATTLPGADRDGTAAVKGGRQGQSARLYPGSEAFDPEGELVLATFGAEELDAVESEPWERRRREGCDNHAELLRRIKEEENEAGAGEGRRGRAERGEPASEAHEGAKEDLAIPREVTRVTRGDGNDDEMLNDDGNERDDYKSDVDDADWMRRPNVEDEGAVLDEEDLAGLSLEQAALKMWAAAQKHQTQTAPWYPAEGPEAFKRLPLGAAAALMREMMPPPPGMAPGVQEADLLNARWAHASWRAATHAAAVAAAAAAASSDWRPADGPTAPEPDVAMAAAAREDAAAAVLDVIDYDPERFQHVVAYDSAWVAAQATPSTLNPKPSTLNPKPSTLNPKPSTLNPKPSTLNPQP
jgi:hypothetical protein